MTQRPDLFGAALPAVGVMDMLRFHKFTIGWALGRRLRLVRRPGGVQGAATPTRRYHNLKPGTQLPADAGHDRRPRRPRGARRTASSSPRRCRRPRPATTPVLIRIETRAGHGAGKPTTKIIEEAADGWAFLVRELENVRPAQSCNRQS